MTKFPKLKTIDLEISNKWITIWLNRPKVKNAFSEKMVDELIEVLFLIGSKQEFRGIKIKGRGNTFCSGGDLKEFKLNFQKNPISINEIKITNKKIGTMLSSLQNIPQTVLSLVDGVAFAGGLGIVCSSDIVIVTSKAKFAISETRLGLPPAQIAPFVVSRLGLTNARRLMLTGSVFSCEEALKIGLADYIVKDEIELEKKSLEVMNEINKCGPQASLATKKMLVACQLEKKGNLSDIAASIFSECMISEEAKEGLSSFLEKRKPKWLS